MAIMADSYSERELIFCENIASGLSNQAAAIKAGYAANSAASQATRLLKKAKIQSKIAELREERRVHAEIDSARVTKELATIAFANVLDLFDENWQFKDRSEISMSLARAVRSVQVVERESPRGTERKITVRMHDKIRALDQLAIQLGLKMDDATAIAALLKYGEVVRTENGYRFEYGEAFQDLNDGP